VPTFREWISQLVALAASLECDALVLDAKGRGAFRNEPQLVAPIFWEHVGPPRAVRETLQQASVFCARQVKNQNIFNSFVKSFVQEL
jgi:uncharacterized protein (TIGR02452 family)